MIKAMLCSLFLLLAPLVQADNKLLLERAQRIMEDYYAPIARHADQDKAYRQRLTVIALTASCLDKPQQAFCEMLKPSALDQALDYLESGALKVLPSPQQTAYIAMLTVLVLELRDRVDTK